MKLFVSTALFWAAPLFAQNISDQLGVSWLKQTESLEVKTWIADQNQKTQAFVRQNAALRAALSERSQQLNPKNPAIGMATRYGRLSVKSGNLVIVTTLGSELVLARKIPWPNGGSNVVTEFQLSPDGTKVAYARVKNGTDLNEWYVMDLSSRQPLAGPFGVRMKDFSWAGDSQHIYYTKWDMTAGARRTENFRVHLQSGKQELIFQPPQTNAREYYAVTDFAFDGRRHLLAYRVQGSAEIPLAAYWGRPGETEAEFSWTPLRVPIKGRLGKFLGIHGPQILFRSSEVGNGFGIVSVDLTADLHTETLIPARPEQVLINAQKAGDKLLLQYFSTKNFAWTIEVADLAGETIRQFDLPSLGLPEHGSLSAFTYSAYDKTAEFTYSDVHIPTKTLTLNLEKLELKVKADAASVVFDGTKVRRSLHWVKSLDGVTDVPIDVYTRTDLDKPKFIYLYYYGYIGIAQFGMWNKKFELALEMGAAVAIVHHRGGGELGLDWQMGAKVDRMISLRDTVAASRYLRDTLGADKVAASGRSFGGMHTLGLLTHFTEDFDVFTPTVPVTEVNEFLNSGLFGYMAVDDFGIERDASGNPLDTLEWHAKLAEWSPLGNIGKMPTLKPVAIFAADHDERVGMEQSYYMAEALNRRFPGNTDVYLYSEKNNGHNARTETADELAFIAQVLGITELNPLR